MAGSLGPQRVRIIGDDQLLLIIHVPQPLQESGTTRSLLSKLTPRLALLSAFCCLPHQAAFAQRPVLVDQGGDLQVGGEAERYLRALQLAGLAKPTNWIIRAPGSLPVNGQPLSPEHPWQRQFVTDSATRVFKWQLLRPGARVFLNSSFPVSTADGPTWAGRGLTGEVRAGVRADYGAVHFQFAPVAFLSQNAEFSLANNNESGSHVYADARFPGVIDAPQRFGSRTYGRFDPGNSTLSVQTNPITFGVSTASQSWGPAREFPLVLSSHSGGFPHAFIGTGAPLNLGILSIHTRLLTGRLSQSAFSPIDTGNTHRWVSAGVLTVIPRGVKGLEFGLIRFVQGISTRNIPTQAQARRVLQGAAIGNGDNIESENQVASAFFRWAFPGAGFEVYGEYGREDYSLDGRRFIQYPDDLRSYLFGFQRVLKAGPTQFGVLRFELANAELSASNRGERGDVDTKVLLQPFPPYLHNVTRQGHTNNGLFLGSAEVYGGAAWRLGFDQYRATGRRSLTLERSLRLDWLPSLAAASQETRPDVLWSAGAETVRFRGSREFGLSVLTTYELNRNLVQKHDALNLRLVFSAKGW